ncbi:L,D-transpeptidase [Verrucomicrobiota bacterium sgz303538]
MTNNLRLLFAAAGMALLAGCATHPTAGPGLGPYKVIAYKPHNPDAVRVKVSTSTQNVYVMEGDRPLMAVQGCVGANGATPLGNFTINSKNKTKRRVSQPDAGYPMAYWCEFKPAYGFHEGFVHPVPRTHGCIRLHREAAARLFALVKPGTPVSIATTQPEDATIGRTVRHLDQSRDPDPPRAVMLAPSWFQDPQGPLLIEQ